MDIKKQRAKWTVWRGAETRCPVCGRVNSVRPDPSFWEGIGMDGTHTCRHSIGVSFPRMQTEGLATFLFDVTYKAA